MTGSEGGANGHTAKKSPPAQASAQDLTGAMALIEPSMPPHFKFSPILTLNMVVLTEMDWDVLRAVPCTIKSCIFLSFMPSACVLDCVMDLRSKLESPNKTK